MPTDVRIGITRVDRVVRGDELALAVDRISLIVERPFVMHDQDGALR